MKIYAQFFKPRQVPGWWLRFTEANPIIPNLIAVIGLTWICYSLALITRDSNKLKHGQFIETFGKVSQSKPLVDKAISLRTAYHKLFPAEVRNLMSELYGNLALYMVVPFLLLLEFLFPCNPSQPLIGKGFLQDAIWYIVHIPITLMILFPIIELLRALYIQHLGFLTLSHAINWPAYIQVIAALLMAEFFIWFNHFARHKIHTLWYFHAVHHSQKEINIFTDDRAHIVDLFIGSLFTFIPFFIFQVSNLYAVSVIALYKPIHNRFIHANLKINLGWLGRVVTSPQFHRVHHSIDPAHQDINFGVYFSIWDYLFRTACKSRTVYPPTGIADSRFPSEDKVRISQLPGNWLAQMAYPFIQVFEKLMSLCRPVVSRMRARFRKNQDDLNQENISLQSEPQRS